MRKGQRTPVPRGRRPRPFQESAQEADYLIAISAVDATGSRMHLRVEVVIDTDTALQILNLVR